MSHPKCLKSQNPTRRSALGGLVAAAVGIVAAPHIQAAATVKAAVPSRAPVVDYDDGDERLTPAQERRKLACQQAMLAAFYEVEDALKCVADNRPEEETLRGAGMFYADVKGIRGHVDHFAMLLASNMLSTAERFAEMKRDRRRLAFQRGDDGCHGCPVLRALRALENAEDVVDSVVDRFERAGDSGTWLAQDVALWAWSMQLFRENYEGCHLDFLNHAAKQAYFAETIAWYRAKETATV